MRPIALFLVVALIGGCSLDTLISKAVIPSPASTKASPKSPTKVVASTSPSPAVSASPAASNGVPNVGTTFTGITATFDGKPCKFTEHADRVYFQNSGLITIGALRTTMTVPVGEHQLQMSVNGKEKSPHTAGFTTTDLKDIGWTIWVGDGKIFPNKFAPTGTPELHEQTVADGKLNLKYKGTVKHMLNGSEFPMELTVTDFPLK